ncbi:NupC/NupG family nucleoside CNT transporter [uncultured Phycicoccus sp.]|uniref:NupC/NupG family nucleoside CNT transporter n=1 Tax=uncultured Phycicoccus sp. TaxID=661422 RepID=UPI002624900F|nr:nucleoside transporter C-terminal domain-containing protein [uncultured Phycicoccus sp.]
MIDLLWGVGGMLVLLAVAAAISTDRRAIRPRTVLAALAAQVLFGVLVLYVPPGRAALSAATQGVQAVIDSSKAGIGFLFGPLVPEEGVVFALQVLPVIVFFAALTSVLYHWRVLQRVVNVLGSGLHVLLGTSRAESVNAATNVFLGQTESPLVIKPFIARMSTSSLFAVMTGGLATVAGSVLVGYALLGAELDQLIAAAFMAAPGALLMAKIVVPETEDVDADGVPVAAGAVADRRTEGAEGGASSDGQTETRTDSASAGEAGSADEEKHVNVIDAAAGGAAQGLKLAANIGAMLLAFISLIALVNLLLGTAGGWFGAEDLTFEKILGWVFAPVMFVVGVPWGEAVAAGSFVGQKTIVNEFVAFSAFGPVAEDFSDKTRAIVTFALTGFANLGSLAILLGGLGGLAPERRPEIARFGIRAIAAATLANLMSAAIAGILIG